MPKVTFNDKTDPTYRQAVRYIRHRVEVEKDDLETVLLDATQRFTELNMLQMGEIETIARNRYGGKPHA